MVEVMLAARASIPVNISAGKVMNDPPPASAFCAPAHTDAMNSTSKISIAPPISLRRPASGRADAGDGQGEAIEAMRQAPRAAHRHSSSTHWLSYVKQS